MNNYRDTLTAAARILSIMRDDAQREMEQMQAQGLHSTSYAEGRKYESAGYRRLYATEALEALLCVDPEHSKAAEREMRARI